MSHETGIFSLFTLHDHNEQNELRQIDQAEEMSQSFGLALSDESEWSEHLGSPVSKSSSKRRTRLAIITALQQQAGDLRKENSEMQAVTVHLRRRILYLETDLGALSHKLHTVSKRYNHLRKLYFQQVIRISLILTSYSYQCHRFHLVPFVDFQLQLYIFIGVTETLIIGMINP